MPNAPWSAISLALTYFGVNSSSSAYISSTPSLVADVDHFVGFVERHAQRLFADHVFAGARDIEGHALVQRIGRGDGDHLDIFFAQHFADSPVKTRGMPYCCASSCAWPGVGEHTATTSASSGMI